MRWTWSNRTRRRKPEAPAAFTMIELLNVVAIIAILAMIAVPNFLEAQVRAKVASARDHMHVLSAALEAYWIDQRAYPPNLIETVVVRPPAPGQAPDSRIVWTQRIDLGDGRWICETSASLVLRLGTIPNRPFFDHLLSYNGVGLVRLTTPVSYIGHLPKDSFFIRPHIGSYPAGEIYYRAPGVWEPIDAASNPTWDLDRMRPFGYFNFTAVDPDGVSIPGFGRTITHIVTSMGPNLFLDFTDIYATAPVFYDPTNGTVSGGDLLLPSGSP